MATVDQYITAAKTYASDTLRDGQSALNSAVQTINSVGYLMPYVDPLNLEQTLTPPVLESVPDMLGANLELPAEPGEGPAYQNIGGIDTAGAPTLSATKPTLSMPVKPGQLPEFTQSLPTINTTVAFPEPPSQLTNPLVDEPVLTERAEPAKPLVSLPGFTAVLPRNDALAPTDLDQKMEVQYRGMAPAMMTALEGQVDAMLAKHNPQYHAQMARIEAQLQKYLDGGTALKPAVEDAIYERARDKQNAEYRRARDASWTDAANRGFTIPTGAVHTAIQAARQNAADNLARASTEIAIAQAEMEQKNLQFAVTTSTGLRTTILNAALGYHQNLVQINGQAIGYAKDVVGLLVETYNIAIKAYSASLDGYRAEVQAYEVKLRGAMTGIELYKAEVDALRSLVQVDMAKVEVYRARMDTLKTLSDVYRSRIDAIIAKANMEKLKLELFQSQVQAYSARVSAKNAEWQGYRSAVDGEQAQVQLYTAQVQGYSAEVQGWRTKIEGQAEAVRAAATVNNARAQQYEAQVRAYSAVVNARGEVARTKLESDRQVLLAFQAKTQAAVSYANMAATYYKTKADTMVSYSGQQLQAQLGMADSMRNYQSAIAQLAISASNQYTGLAQTAMSGMNTLVSAEQA